MTISHRRHLGMSSGPERTHIQVMIGMVCPLQTSKSMRTCSWKVTIGYQINKDGFEARGGLQVVQSKGSKRHPSWNLVSDVNLIQSQYICPWMASHQGFDP